jgi:hypothetical protein
VLPEVADGDRAIRIGSVAVRQGSPVPVAPPGETCLVPCLAPATGTDNLAHGVFATASTPASGTRCSADAVDNTGEPMSTFASGLASGSLATANDHPVLIAGTSGTDANSLWNVVDNNGASIATNGVRRGASRCSLPL